jgi:hypothetical protein
VGAKEAVAVTDITNRDVVDFLEQYIASEQAQLTSDQLLNIQTGINAVITSVNSLTAYQDALANNLAAFEATVTDLLNRIFQTSLDVQKATQPVVLPPNPPPVYGPGDPSVNAAAICSYPSAVTGNDANDRLDEAAALAIDLGEILASFPSGSNPPWLQYGSWDIAGLGPSPASTMAPGVDFATILPTDIDAVHWLNRVAPGYGIVDIGNGRPGIFESASGFWTFLDLDTYHFQLLQAGMSPLGANIPPIWPGLARVTLGTPVALVDGLTLTDPLDGVLVEGITAPAGKQYVTYGSIQSWRHIASLTFITDNGDVEQFQAVNFGSQIFAALSQTRAAGVAFHVLGGVTGTVIPWTIT